MRLGLKLVGFFCVIFPIPLMAADWLAYFPTNKVITGRVMALYTSKEIAQISEKLKLGIANHQEWFKQYLSEQEAGKPLPYHVNFGITETEYQQLLKGEDVKLNEVGTVKIEFKPAEHNKIAIKTVSSSPIDGFLVGKDSVRTPLGITNKFTTIDNKDEKSVTGAWKGVQWSFNNLDATQMKQVNFNEIVVKQFKLAVGKLAKTGEGILYYDVKDVDMTKHRKTMFSYIIFYPLS